MEESNILKPKFVTRIADLKDVAIGESHIAIISNNHLFCCGNNKAGQLGLGDFTSRKIPKKQVLKDLKSVYCGYDSTFILKTDGSLLATGFNEDGQLGIGNNKNQNTFQFVMKDDIKMVSSGYIHTLVLTNDGRLFSFGNNGCGQLGIGEEHKSIKNTPYLVTQDKDISYVACGNLHSFYLKNNGELYSFGSNNLGQLGLGNNDDQFKPQLVTKDVRLIATGFDHSLILKNNGDLMSFGSNSNGQLGLDDLTDKNVPSLILNDKEIRTIACGMNHSFFTKVDGSLFGFGYNKNGQLGNGTSLNQSKPTFVLKETKLELIMGGKMNSVDPKESISLLFKSIEENDTVSREKCIQSILSNEVVYKSIGELEESKQLIIYKAISNHFTTFKK